MRKWRVGSISMGCALVLLGVMIMLSQFTSIDMVKISLIWLPLVLIALGLEIIVYIILSKHEHPRVQYDMLSILFIILLGVVSFVTFVAVSTGITQLIRHEVYAQSNLEVLPSIEQQIDHNINRVIVEPGSSHVSIEANHTNLIHIFGTYEGVISDTELREEHVATFNQVGSTLYVRLLEAPKRYHMFRDDANSYDLTVSLPGGIDVEVRSYVDEVQVNLSNIKSNWYVKHANTATLTGEEQANVTINMAEDREEFIVEPEQNKGENANNQALKTYGSGAHDLSFESVRELEFR